GEEAGDEGGEYADGERGGPAHRDPWLGHGRWGRARPISLSSARMQVAVLTAILPSHTLNGAPLGAPPVRGQGRSQPSQHDTKVIPGTLFGPTVRTRATRKEFPCPEPSGRSRPAPTSSPNGSTRSDSCAPCTPESRMRSCAAACCRVRRATLPPCSSRTRN